MNEDKIIKEETELYILYTDGEIVIKDSYYLGQKHDWDNSKIVEEIKNINSNFL